MSEFGDYLHGQIVKRNMSRREFAHKIGSTHDTVSRMIDGEQTPTLAFLRKLSSYINVDLWTLLKKALPDEIPDPDANIMRAAQLLNSLPKQKREFFIELIEAANLAVSQTNDDERKIGGSKKRKRGGKS